MTTKNKLNHKVMSTSKKLFFVISIIIIQFVFAQISRREMIDEIERMKAEMESMQAEREKEEVFFQRLKKQKTKLLKQKRIENKNLIKTLRQLKSEISQIKIENKNLELKVIRYQEKDEEIALQIAKQIKLAKEDILSGIPFEQERRVSILGSILRDIEAGNGGALEAYNRFLAFYDAEDVYSYDSQVFPKIISINNSQEPVEILRIGRTFLAAQGRNNTYLYSISIGKWQLNPKPLGVRDSLKIKNAIGIIQGKKAPKLLLMPIPIIGLNEKKEDK